MSAIRGSESRERLEQADKSAALREREAAERGLTPGAAGAQAAPHPPQISAATPDKVGSDSIDKVAGGFRPKFTRDLEVKAAAGAGAAGQAGRDERAREAVEEVKVAKILSDQVRDRRA